MILFLFVLNAYASPYTDCFENKAKERLTCDLRGQDLQSIFNASKRECADAALAEIMRETGGIAEGARKLSEGLPPRFEKLVNDKIVGCGLTGEFEFHGTGGRLILR